jgi:nitroimidazol reductase NimA-like FMN-containing flavoprotein (pyridoxamine 5'-phosphate oxidase superfamily)
MIGGPSRLPTGPVVNEDRTMTSSQLVELDPAECLRLLLHTVVGRVAVVVDGRPHIVPVTYAADTNGDVVFRTGPDTILTRVDLEHVAFEIDGVDAQARTGWSVAIHGVGSEITDADDQKARYLRQKLAESWAPDPRPRWFAIYPREITGRRIESAAGGGDDDSHPRVPWS